MIVEDKNRPIGFFDSGVGGLSVYARFREILPFENTIYFGDLLHLPYGEKSKEELVGYARAILNFFKSKNVKAVVIACNTSSAQAYDVIKTEYNFKIYPIIQSCAKIIAESGYKRIGVFATEGTVKAGKYTQELSKYNPDIIVKEVAQKNWVSIVEGTLNDLEQAKKNIKNDIKEMLDFNPDKIILGCTHYPYLLSELKKYADIDLFIDPAKIFVDYIKNDLSTNLNSSNSIGSEEFYVSDNPRKFIENSEIFYHLENLPAKIEIFN